MVLKNNNSTARSTRFCEHELASSLAKETTPNNEVMEYSPSRLVFDLVTQWVRMLNNRKGLNPALSEEHQRLQDAMSRNKFTVAGSTPFILELIREGVTFYDMRPYQEWPHVSRYFRDILCNPIKLVDYVNDKVVYDGGRAPSLTFFSLAYLSSDLVEEGYKDMPTIQLVIQALPIVAGER